MSAIVTRKKKSNLHVSSSALWVVLGLAAVFFLVNYGQELLLAYELNAKADAQRAANAQLADENTRLAAQLEYFQSQKYVEQRAREDLNLRRQDEEVLIPVGLTPVPAGLALGSEVGNVASEDTDGNTGITQPQANWQRWLQLFEPGQ